MLSDTVRGAEASAAIYSIVVAAKLSGLNQRAYLEWLLTEMPDDELDRPGRIDRYLPWSEDIPANCRLSAERAEEAAEMPDEPIVWKRRPWRRRWKAPIALQSPSNRIPIVTWNAPIAFQLRGGFGAYDVV